VIPTNNGRDDIDTWPGEHYKKTRAKASYIGRLQPPTARGGNHIYSPPAWRVCDVCDPVGILNRYEDLGENISTDCPHCGGGKLIPIYYTPEQWEEAGGVLSDDTPVWHDGGDGVFRAGSWGALKGINPNGWVIIIAIPGQDRPPEDWNG